MLTRKTGLGLTINISSVYFWCHQRSWCNFLKQTTFTITWYEFSYSLGKGKVTTKRLVIFFNVVKKSWENLYSSTIAVNENSKKISLLRLSYFPKKKQQQRFGKVPIECLQMQCYLAEFLPVSK